ncbi:integrase [Sphingopyxis sp. H038]|jgi:integrase|uniref:tyrosine-type recombinase/integrase n=1 Tax=unclassified Sphingopyxis TaxID=2614943 RepID=UPI00072FEF7A|nr:MULTISPECIES: integrase arm-type DNA-binding domain-containing protein [unclassified Sphingopyxis]KTE00782.1 integrase [Sphingopyxis sp. H012]KTE11727.1 integrase [Sphingopyxis sp. H053]KTE16367.1 integrase [Sphingopyxis sp. H093]KTE28572.1 integrase [Sphingopyxis sp. H080]KTE33434.1 integrase [Sphingopyxis sp. H038]
MSLSYVQISNAKPQPKAYKMTDADALYLTVQPNGSKLWRMNYRHLGRQKTLYFGAWPEVSLAAARELRDAARKKIVAGIDPAAEKRVVRITRKISADNSFKAIAEEWFAKNEREERAHATLRKIRWLLGIAYPMIGNRPIADITPQEALAVLRKVEATGRYESARRMRSVLSRVFRYAIATARTDRDVAVDLRGALTTPKVKHHAAVTTAKEAGELLRAIDGYTGHEITALALRLSPHVFVRPGELRKAEWAEVDVDAALWSIPAEKMKMGRPHRVPLSRQVLEILEELHALTGHGRYLFPSFRTIQRCMSENTVNAALRRLGYSRDEMTAHGFRAMAATLLNEMGIWNADTIEKQLAHLDASQVRRAYTRGEYWDERVRMMQHWSDYLDQLRDGAQILRPDFRQSGHSAR